MATSIYLSGIGIALNKHYCKGDLKYVSITVHEDGCGSAGCEMQNTLSLLTSIPKENLKPCCIKALEEMAAEKKSCCEDETDFEKVKQELKSGTQLELNQLIQLAYIIIPQAELLFSIPLSGKQWNFLHYHPPLSWTDITVRLQTFLI
ncbi:MAG: hypothetical protein IPI60_19605 [Saprospiraceae bacterium]|nr:hypothetical protein [Saprospiraceae bacterium]